MACWATVIGRPGALPAGWVEVPHPPWSVGHAPRFACPEHAQERLELVDRQWVLYAERTYVVSAVEHERVLRSLRAVVDELAALKFSGERAGDLDL